MSHVDESQENANKQMKSDVPIEKDFFGDELRGHRLLKAARLSTQERQSILTTGNSTLRRPAVHFGRSLQTRPMRRASSARTFGGLIPSWINGTMTMRSSMQRQ